MSTHLDQSVVEEAAPAWLETMGNSILGGPELAARQPLAEIIIEEAI
jgi:hypothetical protein